MTAAVSSMASSCTSFTTIKLNWKTITDIGNSQEYYLKPLSQSMQRIKCIKIRMQIKIVNTFHSISEFTAFIPFP
jgi:hypothetical protein